MQPRLIKEATGILKSNLGESLDGEGRSFFVKRGMGRRLVLTDIHGSFQTFVKLLRKLKLTKDDQLFILGDMINRAPYSIYVIEKIAELLVDGYSVFPLRGNHEQLFLKFAITDQTKLQALADRQYSAHLLKDGVLPKSIYKFFNALPYFYELEDHYLVHAGFNIDERDLFDSWKDMLWIRSMRYDKKKLNGKKVVHGHVPTTLTVIEKALANEKPEIKLDNGCIRAGVFDFGKLVCLDLDSSKLTTKRNIDFVPANL
ncbi:metallophosphoesterase [Cryomorphaceae bacterium 1068]|nr:metallophosphoesterase [Cryomorphaceae bacterium 1068]